VIVDQRLRNLSVTHTSGLDLSTQYNTRVSESDVHLGLDGTYVFRRLQQITADSPSFETVNTIFNRPDLDARVCRVAMGRVGSQCVRELYGFVHDNRVPTSFFPVASYTTIDARLAYDFSARFPWRVLIKNYSVLSVQNLLNRDPPRTAVIGPFDTGFDPRTPALSIA